VATLTFADQWPRTLVVALSRPWCTQWSSPLGSADRRKVPVAAVTCKSGRWAAEPSRPVCWEARAVLLPAPHGVVCGRPFYGTQRRARFLAGPLEPRSELVVRSDQLAFVASRAFEAQGTQVPSGAKRRILILLMLLLRRMLFFLCASVYV
jgi:hypothetical protein